MHNLFASLSVAQLEQAAAIKERIEALERDLSAVLGGATVAAPAAVAASAVVTASAPTQAPPRRKRRVSKAGRERLSAIAKARWARVKAKGGHTLKGS